MRALTLDTSVQWTQSSIHLDSFKELAMLLRLKLVRLSLAVTVALGLTLAVGGCKKEQKPADTADKAPPPKKVEKPKTGLEAGNPVLVEAVKTVMEKCEVSDFGYLRPNKCKDNADKELRKTEKEVGVKESVMTYCLALTDENHLIQALAAAQMNLLAYSRAMRENADEKILKCLIKVLTETKKARVARPVARTATYVATALKKHEQIIKVLEDSELREVKAAGYGAMWANGRMDVFETLAKKIKEDKDVTIRVASINSFREGGRLNDEEKKQVCALIEPLMTDEELRVAGAAATRIANSCPEMRDKVLVAAEAMVKKGKFDTGYVSAVGSVHGFFGNKATNAQKRRIVTILTKVLKDAKQTDLTRSSALRKIAWVDKKIGQRLAKRYSKSDSTFIRRASEWILKSKTPATKARPPIKSR